MATLGLLRIAQANHLARAAGPLLMRHVCPLAAVGVNSQSKSRVLTVQQSRGARIYGPAGDGPSITGHWKTERIGMAVLPVVIPLAFIFPNTALDLAVSAAVVLHVHWGLEGVSADYIHQGEALAKIAKPAIMLMSIAAFGGLCYLNYNDIGIVKGVTKFFLEL